MPSPFRTCHFHLFCGPTPTLLLTFWELDQVDGVAGLDMVVSDTLVHVHQLSQMLEDAGPELSASNVPQPPEDLDQLHARVDLDFGNLALGYCIDDQFKVQQGKF